MIKISLKTGEQSPFVIATDPSPVKIYEYVYESENHTIVTVDENGILTAVGPGETRVHVTVRAHDENEEDDGNVCGIKED